MGRRREGTVRQVLREQPTVAAVGETVAEDEHVGDREQIGARCERLRRERGDDGGDEQDSTWALHVLSPAGERHSLEPWRPVFCQSKPRTSVEMCNGINGQPPTAAVPAPHIVN